MPSTQLSRTQTVWLSFIAAAALLVVGTVFSLLAHLPGGDVWLYHKYAQAISHGLVPYRSFYIEYPPGILPFILVPWLLGRSYLTGFVAMSFFTTSSLLWYVRSLLPLRQWLWWLLPIGILGEFVFYDLDIFAAVALFGAILLLHHKRYGWSVLLLTAATWIKAYPALSLLGSLFALPVVERYRYLRRFSAIIVMGAICWTLAAPQGVKYALLYHLGRPLEMESTGAMFGYVGAAFGLPVHRALTHSSYALQYSGAASVGWLMVGLLVFAIAWLGWQGIRGRLQARPAHLSILAILPFIFCFKAGSPQYLVAVLALIPLAIRELPTLASGHLRRVIILSLVVEAQILTTFRWAGSPGPYEWLIAGLAVGRAVALCEYFVFIARHTVKINSRNQYASSAVIAIIQRRWRPRRGTQVAEGDGLLNR